MYAAAGNADLTNWARAILVIEPTHVEGVFEFIAAKRGKRIGWGKPEENFLSRRRRHLLAPGHTR